MDENLDDLLSGVINNLFGPSWNPKSISLPKFEEIESSFGNKVLSAAQADLGVREDLGKNDGKRIREYFKNFNMGGGQDWCAAAVSTWIKEAGGGPIPGGVGARNIAAQFQQIGKWVPREKITSKAMTPGNIVVWSRGGPDSWKGHIGVLSSVNGNNFNSIEANSGPKSDSVVVNSHSIKDSNLLGIGILSDYVPKQSLNNSIEGLLNKYGKNNIFNQKILNKISNIAYEMGRIYDNYSHPDAIEPLIRHMSEEITKLLNIFNINIAPIYNMDMVENFNNRKIDKKNNDTLIEYLLKISSSLMKHSANIEKSTSAKETIDIIKNIINDAASVYKIVGSNLHFIDKINQEFDKKLLNYDKNQKPSKKPETKINLKDPKVQKLTSTYMSPEDADDPIQVKEFFEGRYLP